MIYILVILGYIVLAVSLGIYFYLEESEEDTPSKRYGSIKNYRRVDRESIESFIDYIQDVGFDIYMTALETLQILTSLLTSI